MEKHDFPQFKKTLGKYSRKNYQWIIGSLLTVIAILVAVILVPWGVSLTTKAEEEQASKVLSSTQTYYFTPTTTSSLANVEDGADCWTASGSSERSDAYRCSVGNRIYDPCFYQADVKYVDCPSSPASHKVITVAKIEKNNPIVENTRPPIPWFVKLEGGVSCRYITGVTEVIADGRMDYGCENGQWLSLPVEHKSDLLIIKCFNSKRERIELCKLREAWY